MHNPSCSGMKSVYSIRILTCEWSIKYITIYFFPYYFLLILLYFIFVL